MSAEAYAADLGRKLAADEVWERLAADAEEDLDGIRHEIRRASNQLYHPDPAILRRQAEILREQAAVLDGVANTLEGR